MEDNKLVFPVGFDLTKGTEEVKKKFEELQKQAQKMSESITKASGKGVKSKELTGELAKIKSSMTAVTHAVKQFADVQVKSEQASSKVAIAQNKAAKSAQQLEAATARAEMAKLRLANAQNKINTGFKTQSRLLSQVTMQIGAYTSIYALLRFATAVRDITAQFELQRVALTAILQDKAAADKIFGQILVQALESPFRIKDIVSYTKQLAAYRVETENLFETTKRLADISAGLGVDMSRLVLAYGQVRAASVLRGQELRQFTEAGIPLVKLLADKFTELRGTMVSTGEVFELISKRAVPFRMIEEIFNDMTDAGGIFYNMQKIQAETLHGVWMNLKDAYDKMYYEMGQKNMGVLKGLGLFLRGMADNWETIATVLQSVIIGYLSYITVTKILTVSTKVLTAEQIKAIATEETLLYVRLRGTMGVKAATAATKLHTIAQSKLAVANGFLTKSFWKLTAAMAANPIAAIVAGIVAIGVAAGIAIIKANSLKTAMDRLGESTNKFVEMNDKVRPAIETYKELSIVAFKSEKQMKDMAGAVETLANKYPSATKIMGEYGDEVEITIGKVERLYEAEMKLASITLQSDLEKLEEKKAIFEAQKKAIENTMTIRTEQGTVEGWLAVSWARGMQKDLKRVSDKLAEVNAKIKETKEALGLKQDGGVEEPLAGLKKYVSELESLQKRSTGAPIKLYDSEEDISKFGSDLDLLEDIAKKYKEAGTSVEYLSKQINNLSITQKERDTYKSDLDIAKAEQELARLVLERQNALYLIEDKDLTKAKTKQDILRDEINMVKDARDAYEAYLKTMTEVRAKQTVESQLKFAGLDFDISDAGAYREYLQNVYDRIKSDPNYAAVRTLIGDMLVKFDIDRVERELNAKLTRIANNIAKTQRANDFFEKILGITGDIELSKMLTIKYTGVEAGDIGYQMKEQLQSALREALGDEGLDLSGMGIEQIRAIVETIPEGLSTAGDKSKKFFQDFEKYMQDAQTSALELDEKLRKLGLDDASLFGTGVTLDVQKITRDLSNSNKELARERSQLEAEILADKRAKDKKWLNEQLVNIDKIFRTRQENEKTLSQDKLNDLAKGMFEEQKRMLGIDALIDDIADKTLGQINEALSLIRDMGEADPIKISDETIGKLKNLNYEIDDLSDVDLQTVFDSIGDAIPDADKKMLTLLKTMQELGFTTGELRGEYIRLVEALLKNIETEKIKRKTSDAISAIDDVISTFEDLVDEIGLADSAIGKMVENAKSAISTFKGLQGSIKTILETTSSGKGGSGIDTAAIMSQASSYAAVITIVITMIKLMANEMKKANDAAYSLVDRNTKKITQLYDKLISSTGTASLLVDDQIAKYKELSKTVNGFAADLRGDWDIYYDKMSNFEKLVEYVFEARSDISRDIYQYLSVANLRDADELDNAIARVEESIEAAKKTGDVAILNNLKAQLDGIKAALNEMDEIIRSMVGDMANAVMEAMTGLARGSSDVLSQFSESLSESLENIIESNVFAVIMGDTFAKFKSDIAAALERGDLDAVTKAYADLYETMINNQALYARQLEIAKQIAAEYGIILFDSMNTGSTEAETLYNNIEEINRAIEQLKSRSESVDTQLLGNMKSDAAEILAEFEAEKARLWQEYQSLIANEPAYGDPERQTWEWDKSYYEQFFPQGVFGDMSAGDEDYKKRWAAYKELLDDIAEMESKLVSGEAIDLLEAQKEAILSQIYSSGYDKYATDEMKQEDTLKDYLADMELYNQLAAEATDPEQQERWKELARLAKLAFDNAVIDGFNEKLDESLSGFDDNIDKMAFLKNMLSSLSDQTKIDEVNRQLEELEGIVYKDLYSAYADDATKFNDELKDMQKQIQWAIENDYPDLAEWIQKAYDTKVLDKWKEGIDEIANGLDDDFDKYKYYQDEIKKAAGMLVMAILGGDQEGSATWATRLKYLEDLLGELEGSMEENMWDKYATDAQKYEQELSDINKDLQWALDNYPELADEIADAFNTRVLEEWQDKWDETFGDIDLNLERLNAIEAELAAIGAPEISEEEARAGRDAALLSGDTDAYNYYQEQLLMHQKINILLDERADIIDELGNKYKTDEETYQDEIAQYESDIAAMRALLKEAREDGDAEAASRWEKEIADAEAAMEEFINNADFDALQEEFERQFGDISDIGTAEVKKMLDAFRQQVEDSELPPEMKEKILDDIDGIYDELDRRTQESFNKIGTAIKDISSLLENFGAEQGLVDSISAIGDAVSVLGDITYAIAKNDWWSVFSLAVKLINSVTKAIQNLVSLLDSDPFAGVEEIGIRVSNAEKVVEKAVGTNVVPAQGELMNAYQEAINKLQGAIKKESGKKDSWWTRLWGTAPDKEAIAEAKKQIAEYEDLMDDLHEAMKADFLQTDYTSFSDSLAEILIAPWDSYAEMMDAVNELTDQTINNIVKHALSLHLQAQVKQALDALYERGISEDSFDIFRGDLAKIVADGQLVAKYYGQFYDDMASSSEAYNTISRITESQANSFLGYYQNYLIIMTDMHNIMKRIWDNMNHGTININLDAHLSALQTIVANTGALVNNTSRLGQMADDIKSMKNSLAKSGAY